MSKTDNGNWLEMHDGGGNVRIATGNNPRLTIKANGVVNVSIVSEYSDNAAALVGGLVAGDFYRTGDVLKIVH